MHDFVAWLQETITPVRMFVVAFFDSSLLSIPEVNDVLVVTQSSAHPPTAWMFVLAATLGSVAGCAVLWLVGKRKGEPYLVRKFGAERAAQARHALERWNVLALAVPALLPPPMPFKIFVFSSGVFGVPFPRFLLTIAAARGLRYTLWGIAGSLYGPQALGWFERHADVIIPVFILVVMLAVLLTLRRRRPARPPA